MEEVASSSANGWFFENSDGEEEFCSCCAEDEDWEDIEESVAEEVDDDLDEFSLKMFFKGISVCQPEGSSSGLSGIGVVMERSPGIPLVHVQKTLDFYVEESVAEYLALMDGLLEALRNGIKKVFAFTDSEAVHRQITEAKDLEDPLLTALGQRILEHAKKLEAFVLKLVPSSKLKKSLLLAQEATGILCSSPDGNGVPLERFNCPFPNCSALLDPQKISSTRESCSRESNKNTVECPECHRLVCIRCHVPWHASLSCEEYQTPREERNEEDVMLHHLAQSNSWIRCEQCSRMIELTQGCFHMTCWCGHEFCFSCGAEYRDGQQTCHCAYHDEENEEQPVALSSHDEPWRWESFELPTSTLDAYTEQERSQLALIQRFLAGGFGLSDLNPGQSPPRCTDSFVDTMKDLHQLPWLERFVSVISDNYHEDYIQ